MALTIDQARLWARIQSFPLDVTAHPIPFTASLAREQGWSREFAQRVTGAYRRFLLIAATADQMVVPSDAVDQAWHLHLVDTHAYWDDLCGTVLGRPLHHTPSRGGGPELIRHRARYEATLERYRALFDESPPSDIWPDTHARFRGRYERVNRDEAWVIRKRWIPAAALAGLASVLLAGCVGIGFSRTALGAVAILTILAIVIAAIARSAQANRRRTSDAGGCAGGGCSCPGSGDSGGGCSGGSGGCGGGCGGS